MQETDIVVDSAPYANTRNSLNPELNNTRNNSDSLNRSLDPSQEKEMLSQLTMPEESISYQVTSYRWVILFFFFNCTVFISCCQTSLTPVAAPLAAAFGVPVLTVTMTSIIFSVTYIPMTFVAIWMFKAMQPSVVFRIGCVNILFGAWIRSVSLATDHFGMILVGYTIVSLSYPIFLAAVTLVCNKWLGDNERTFWT